MIEWARRNGCYRLVVGIPNEEYEWSESPSAYPIGPTGGPSYRPWDYETKNRPSDDELTGAMQVLFFRWKEIVGAPLARVTRPLSFAGKKARRLLVLAQASAKPPWGDWSWLSPVESQRREFTQFRAAINQAVEPHEVDHVDFIEEGPKTTETGRVTVRPLSSGRSTSERRRIHRTRPRPNPAARRDRGSTSEC